MGEPGRKIAHPTGVYHEYVVPGRIIEVLLKVDVVELRDEILQLLLLQHLLYEILTIVPPPRLVDLTEILNDE